MLRVSEAALQDGSQPFSVLERNGALSPAELPINSCTVRMAEPRGDL